MKWSLIVVFSLLVSGVAAQEADSTGTEDVNHVFQSDTLIEFAKSLIGVPYCYGGRSLQGFDCSGFVNYVYSHFGFEVPRSTIDFAKFGTEVPMDSCRKGDIILFAGRNKDKRPVGHAGIIISLKDEPLEFIHSATSNKRGIVITAFDAFEYYKSRFVKIVRVFDAVEVP